MRMTNELEKILKRRLERSETSSGNNNDNNDNGNNNSSSNDIAFISPPITFRKKKEKEAVEVAAPIEMQKGSEEQEENENVKGEKVQKADCQTDENNVEICIKEQHQNLTGKDRLNSIVRCLGESCPWTKTISSKEMLGWLRSELDELEKELEQLDFINELNLKDGAKNVESEREDDEEGYDLVDKKKELISFLMESLTSEMGDILFDVLMLDMIVKR